MSEQTDSNRRLGRYSRESWRAMYDQYNARVWYYVSRWIGRDAHAVADVVQETFLAAARNWEQFDANRGTVWAWLSGIAHHQSAFWWRKKNQDGTAQVQASQPELSADQALSMVSSSATSPVAALEIAETVERVRSILAAMNPDHAALLTAKYNAGNSVAELQEMFGGTVESIRSKLARARNEFRTRMTASEETQ